MACLLLLPAFVQIFCSAIWEDMTQRIQKNDPFNRPPRIQNAFRPVEIDIPAPPLPVEEPARNLLLMILPMGSFLVMGLFYALAFRGGGSGVSGWLYALPMIAMAIFTFISAFVMYGEQKHEQKKKTLTQLRDYHRTLDKKESRLLAGRSLQTALMHERFPSPAEIVKRVVRLNINLWERRPDDPDFLSLRLGLGNVPSLVSVKNPDPDLISPAIRRAYSIYAEYRQAPNAPIVIDLKQIGSTAIVGKRTQALSFIRALIAQVAALNAPDDVHIYLFSSEQYYRSWQWMRWLPHLSKSHTGGRADFLAFDRKTSKDQIAEISKAIDDAQAVSEDKNKPAMPATACLMIFDNDHSVRDEPVFDRFMKTGKEVNAFSVALCDTLEDVPSDCQSIIEISEDDFTYSKVGADGIKTQGEFDKLSFVDVDNFAHSLIPVTVRSLGQDARVPSNLNLMQVYQVNSIENLDINARWQKIPKADGLLPYPVPLGNETYASPMIVHLAENIHGPHGLIAGTTGSGKSELLQMLVSSLAIEHHPYLLNFLLIDFKGESTFGVFKNLPHTVGLVSNLEKTSALRALEAIKAENYRRQRFLREKDVEDITEYHEKLYRLGHLNAAWEPLPHLFIIVDEFAQMAVDMPSFLPELVATVRVGRSLGLHLILATQRPAGVVNDEMRANLNFRISLRVQSIDDSRDMLRRPDAAFLPPNLPGRAYFQLGDGGTPRQFQVARAGAGYEDFSRQDSEQANSVYRVAFDKKILISEDFSNTEKDKKNERPSIARVLTEYMRETYQNSAYKPMEDILLPPLPHQLVLGGTGEKKERQENKDYFTELSFVRWEGRQWGPPAKDGEFRIPIGIIDSLATQSQPSFWLNFLDYGGHVMVVGGPQSGKTSLLQTIAHHLALGFTPAEVNIYALSFAGRELEIIQSLPHVGSVIQGNETEKFNRLLRYLNTDIIERRKLAFSEINARDLVEYNATAAPEKRLPFVCVMIDNFGELRNLDYDDQMVEIERLIQNGRAYGIHFVLTALQSNDIPYKISNLIQWRLAFNIADHGEYILLVGRPESLDFDVLPKGRAFVSGTPPTQCQIVMPPTREEWARLAKSMNAARVGVGGSAPREISELPRTVYLSRLLQEAPRPQRQLASVVGIDGDSLEAFAFDWKSSPHLLVGGPSQSGRTLLLHSIVLSLARQYSPDELWVVLMDGSNGSLKDLRRLPHVIEWVNEEDGLARNIAHLQAELTVRRNRANGSDGEFPEKLSEILFVIDDYDITSEALAINEAVLTKLGKHLRQDSDLGFHIVLSVISDNLQGDPLLKQLKLARSGVSLVNVDTLDYLGARTSSAMRKEDLSQGRGYVVTRSGTRLVQFALPNTQKDVEEMATGQTFMHAKWKNPASDEEIESVRQESAPDPSLKKAPADGAISGKRLIDMGASLERYMDQQKRAKDRGIS